jgi:short-subunit dehydrogenase
MNKDSDKTGATALITGATSGIGYELTKLFARDGFDLAIVARDTSRLDKIADELRRNANVAVTVIPKDLSQATAAEEIYRDLQSKGIEIDILVNNAGFNVYGPFGETNTRKELQMMQVHMVTLTHLTKLFLPGMLKRKFGKILNLASTASFTPGPGNAVYCATKAYVLSFSEAIAEELRGTGVSVTALCPGPTKTEFAERADMADTKIFRGRLSSAAEVARAGYRALMRGRTTVVVGRNNKLLVFSLRFSPRSLVAKIAKSILSRDSNPSLAAIRPAH